MKAKSSHAHIVNTYHPEKDYYRNMQHQLIICKTQVKSEVALKTETISDDIAMEEDFEIDVKSEVDSYIELHEYMSDNDMEGKDEYF